MTKAAYIICSILSFGILPLVVRSKAKKASKEVRNELTSSDKIEFDINDFVTALGGKENIVSVEETMTNVIVKLNDVTKVIVDLKEKFNINGVNKTSNSLILVFGDNAKKISLALNNILK
mgnify:CR=1 FL=1